MDKATEKGAALPATGCSTAVPQTDRPVSAPQGTGGRPSTLDMCAVWARHGLAVLKQQPTALETNWRIVASFAFSLMVLQHVEDVFGERVLPDNQVCQLVNTIFACKINMRRKYFYILPEIFVEFPIT